MLRHGCIAETWLHCCTLEMWLHYCNVEIWQHWVQPLWRCGCIATMLRHGSTECSHFGDVVTLLHYCIAETWQHCCTLLLCCRIQAMTIFQKMIIEMLFNIKIHIIVFWTIKYIYIYIYIYKIVYNVEGNLSIIFLFFHLDKISIRYEFSSLRFCVMFKWSMV